MFLAEAFLGQDSAIGVGEPGPILDLDQPLTAEPEEMTEEDYLPTGS